MSRIWLGEPRNRKSSLHIRKRALLTRKWALYICRRALHIRKWALCIRKRALLIHKCALYMRQRVLHICKVALYIRKRALYMFNTLAHFLRKGLLRRMEYVWDYFSKWSACASWQPTRSELESYLHLKFKKKKDGHHVTPLVKESSCWPAYKEIHSYVWHDSLRCVTWFLHLCDTPYSYVWNDSFICATCV